MEKILVDPAALRQFGDGEGVSFCLVTNPEVEHEFEIKHSGRYHEYLKIVYTHADDFDEVLDQRIPKRAHLLVISPKVFFRSPRQEKIGPTRKLIAMACNSTPTGRDAISHFLRVIEQTDPEEQQAMADRFFKLSRRTDYLQFVDPRHGARARFDHHSGYIWNEQAGRLDWGEQQIAPAGEISVLPLMIHDFDERLRLAINGTLAIEGNPIVHSGSSSYLREDQERIHKALASLENGALIATIANGTVTDIQATSAGVERAREMLTAMFMVDSRYCTVWEVGFGINTHHGMYPGNCAMNEVHGGGAGVVHFGLGLTPYTQYHIDIICPWTEVLGSGGEQIFGSPSSRVVA